MIALLKAIETGDAEPLAVINANKYIQHNLGAADGLSGFGALLQPARRRVDRFWRAMQDSFWQALQRKLNSAPVAVRR